MGTVMGDDLGRGRPVVKEITINQYFGLVTSGGINESCTLPLSLLDRNFSDHLLNKFTSRFLLLP